VGGNVPSQPGRVGGGVVGEPFNMLHLCWGGVFGGGVVGGGGVFCFLRGGVGGGGGGWCLGFFVFLGGGLGVGWGGGGLWFLGLWWFVICFGGLF